VSALPTRFVLQLPNLPSLAKRSEAPATRTNPLDSLSRHACVLTDRKPVVRLHISRKERRLLLRDKIMPIQAPHNERMVCVGSERSIPNMVDCNFWLKTLRKGDSLGTYV
jgi:hypothetical protein